MKLTKNYTDSYLASTSINGYSFDKSSSVGQVSTLNACRVRNKVIKYFFAPIKALSSKPVFTISREGVTVSLFYYTGNDTVKLNDNKINRLGRVLSAIFGRQVKLEFVKLYYPHMNRSILAQFLRINAANYNFRRLKGKLFKKVRITKNAESTKRQSLNLPSHIIGIKVQISGRLETERVRPRKTVSTAQLGAITSDSKGFMLDYGTFTSKNTKGAFTVKVWIGQVV
jgi:ribosomal protein S3